jgi:hypothetical protein
MYKWNKLPQLVSYRTLSISHMQNYHIQRENDDTFHIFYESVFIGTITKSLLDPGYIVAPAWGDHTGYFVTLERACIELVSHYYSSHHGQLLEC